LATKTSRSEKQSPVKHHPFLSLCFPHPTFTPISPSNQPFKIFLASISPHTISWICSGVSNFPSTQHSIATHQSGFLSTILRYSSAATI